VIVDSLRAVKLLQTPHAYPLSIEEVMFSVETCMRGRVCTSPSQRLFWYLNSLRIISSGGSATVDPLGSLSASP
jgi:hypothetical protein